MVTTWQVDEWEGCYPSNWKGTILPAAIAHPAKFSSRLIRRIYEHIVQEGWVEPGDTILDPFGGVSMGAFDALRVGLRWRGCELEPRFAELGNANISYWNSKFSQMPKWSGDAVLYQGDSRYLLDVLNGRAQGAVSSPPYADGAQHTGGDDPHPDRMQGGTYYGVGIAGAISSPPYAEARIGQESGQEHCGRGDQYGESLGQLGAMEAGGFEAAVSSPPFGAQQSGQGIAAAMRGESEYDLPNNHTGKHGYQDQAETDGNLTTMSSSQFSAAISSPPFRQSEGGTPEPKPGGVIDERLYARHAAGNSSAEGYGASDGQLANMGEGDFQGAVASPPFENTQGFHDKEFSDQWGPKQVRTVEPSGYGETIGNIGNDSGDDFWLAARQIVEQVYLALEPGGHAVWVCKDFVKDKKRVPFSDQWRQLCEAVGFKTIHEHHALLTKKMGSQHTMEGDVVHSEKKYASFFRRLAESKGSPKIGWETIWCMQKPEMKS